MNYAQTLGERAKVAAPAIANASPKLKNEALAAIAAALLQQTDRILQANAEDLAAAVQNNMTESLQDRLRLTPARMQGMADAIEKLYEDEAGRTEMGKKARTIAEEQFDRPQSYKKIIELIEELTENE